MKTKRLGRIASVLFALPLATAGCMRAAGGTSAELVDARAAYARAAASPASRDARPALIEARQSLDVAEQAHRDDPMSHRERHLAYVAKRRAQLAIAKAETLAAQRDAQARKSELKHNAEEQARAAEQARAQAELAQSQLDTANEQANAALRQLEGATQQAASEAARRATAEADLAKLEAELADTRRQLAKKGNVADAQVQALKDREVALQAQVDLLRVDRDRAEKEKSQLQVERDRALATIRVFATVNEVDSRGLVITLPAEIMFRTGSAKLLPRAKTKLDELATALGQLGANQQFVIEGHTDSRGSAAANERLSKRRALAVRTYLIEQGVDGGRVIARGKGEDEPVASNEDADGRAENRRVEIVVTPAKVSAER